VPADHRARLVFTFRFGKVTNEAMKLFNTTWERQFDNFPDGAPNHQEEEVEGRTTWTHGTTLKESAAYQILKWVDHTGTFHTNTHKREGVGGGEVAGGWWGLGVGGGGRGYIHTHT
jgi:hypothetical protein